MFRTKRTIDRTGRGSVKTDGPSDWSTSGARARGFEARQSAHAFRSGRNPSVTTAHSPCIYGTNRTLSATTPVPFVHSVRSLLVDSTRFHGERVEPGHQSHPTSPCELLGHNHSCPQPQIALHPFAGPIACGHQ
jgi:hypothetical protein